MAKQHVVAVLRNPPGSKRVKARLGADGYLEIRSPIDFPGTIRISRLEIERVLAANPRPQRRNLVGGHE
ncbi:hypothetical protein [Bradyrhizobium embrapense]|uniref:hypothetical protein n=1 Tax=Bradyrhizobium embrapense TaxID=630921 RepID=UPI00067B4BF9|nr:hypothetical protein [Bradyrhizobium embrapense]